MASETLSEILKHTL